METDYGFNEQEFWKEFAEDEKRHNEIVNMKNVRMVKAILKVKGFGWLADFLYDYKESECTDIIEIVSNPCGQRQSSYWGKTEGVFVEQYCTGEDSYHGNIYFPIKPKKWLKCPFAC